MIDNLSILLSHCLILLAFWLLSRREGLDTEAPPERDPETQGFGARRPRPGETGKQHRSAKADPADA